MQHNRFSPSILSTQPKKYAGVQEVVANFTTFFCADSALFALESVPLVESDGGAEDVDAFVLLTLR